MVFIRGIAVGVNAAVKVIKSAVFNCHVDIRGFIELGIFSVEAIGQFVRRVNIDGAPLSVFVIGKGTVCHGYIFGSVNFDKMSVSQVREGDIFDGYILAVRNADRLAFIAFSEIDCHRSLARDADVFFSVVTAYDALFINP